MLDNYKKILVFDFETTGLYAYSDQIIEIGALLIEKDGLFETQKELSVLLQADKRLPDIIKNITGITDDLLLREGVPQEVGFRELFNLIDDDTLLCAYNIQFDLSFLLHYIKKYHSLKHHFKNPILDVMALYKDRHPYPHKLDQAVKTYHVEIPNTHRALDDVKATYEVMKNMAMELDNIDKYVNVIGFNPKYRVNESSKLSYVKYVAQYGGRREIEKS
ncbi:MAG: 3'-5' exonuclease [Acholeplasmataceae bacterium]|jgi:DNA polymerase III epsilon subunit family exonuclease|nr:3'-5' exonuclease [Acholeplasmataceae bacterium]